MTNNDIENIKMYAKDYDLPIWKVTQLYQNYHTEGILHDKLEECLGTQWEDD